MVPARPRQSSDGLLCQGTINLIATQQGIFALTGTTYATIGGAQPSASATPSAVASTSPTAAPVPATPSAPNPVIGWTTAGLLVLMLAFFVLARRRAS